MVLKVGCFDSAGADLATMYERETEGLLTKIPTLLTSEVEGFAELLSPKPTPGG